MNEVDSSRPSADVDAVLLPLSDALDARRVERQWSMEALASRADLARMSVFNLLALRRDPRMSTIIKAARALGFDVVILVKPKNRC